MWTRFVLLAALAALAAGQRLTVLRVIPDTEEQLHAVHQYLEANPLLDVWAHPRKVGMFVDVSLTPKERESYVDFLEGLGLDYEVFVDDVQRVVKTQMMSANAERSINKKFGWTAYNKLSEINAWMDSLAAAHKEVSVVTIGKSSEGKPLKGVVIKFGSNLPVVMVESGIHAREWITPAAATYFIDQILKSPAGDVVRKYEWHIFPSTNPDGYEYSWTNDRTWRKTRSTHWFFFKGVDANRNWPFQWTNSGLQYGTPWAQTFAGPSAASEPETQALVKHVDQYASRMHVYISLHSYSQLLMWPWGYTHNLSGAHDKLASIGAAAVKAIKSRNGTEFVHGNIADAIYTANGNSIDYAHSKCVPYPFVFELRDTGKYGFLLPANQILDASAETWDGVRVIVDQAYKNGVPSSNPTSC